MKHTSTSTSLLLLSAALISLAGCNDGYSDNSYNQNNNGYTDFVIKQFQIDPETADPTPINDRNFSFVDMNDASAYDQLLY